MTANPFRYGREVDGDQFYDRAETAERLYRSVAGGAANVVLYAPRRFGKTSLVKRVLARVRAEGFATIYFDFMKVESLRKFCEAYAAAAYSLADGRIRTLRRIGTFLKSLRPTFSLDEAGQPSIGLDFSATPPTTAAIEEVLDLPERVVGARRTVVVAFDEFQEIAGLSSEFPLERIFRSCIQRHRHVRYVFLGSKTHLMRRMFTDHARPFYESAEILHLGKPPRAESMAFVKARFAAARLGISNAAVARILGGADNVPYYLQAVASMTYEAAVSGGGRRAGVREVAAAERRLLDAKSDVYEITLEGLSSAQRILMVALAHEPIGNFDATYRRRHGLGGSSSVHSALKVLVERGLVECVEGVHALVDPFLALYLKQPSVEVADGRPLAAFA